MKHTSMDIKKFSFNKNAMFGVGSNWVVKKNLAIILTRPSIYVQQQNSFDVRYQNVFEKYKLPKVKSDEIVKRWNSNSLQFWQNQLNFAVWCATSGCNVSYNDHIMASNPFIRSLYNFHVYYTIRRILTELKVALPQEQSWNAFDNSYDRTAYERICGEFRVSPSCDWRLPGDNNGLGTPYHWWKQKIRTIKEVSDDLIKTSMINPSFAVSSNNYREDRMSFAGSDRRATFTVDYIQQVVDADYTNFITDQSNGFTRPGVERLNDSIRTYVWAILGAQAQTRTNILGTGTAFDAQNWYVANLEDAINSPVDIPSSISRYENMLQYASSKVDFVYGIGLYMAPSDMSLHITTKEGYNNEIVIASETQVLGVNDDINTDPVPLLVDTGEKEVHPQATTKPGISDQALAKTSEQAQIVRPEPENMPAEKSHHEEEKTALIVSGIVIVTLAIWFLR